MTYQKALAVLTDWFHEYHDDKGVLVRERHIDDKYNEAVKVVSEALGKLMGVERQIKNGKFIAPFICDPLNGEIIHPSDLRLLMAQETAQRVLQTLYNLCFVGADKINKYGTVVTAQEILDVAKDEGVKIGQ